MTEPLYHGTRRGATTGGWIIPAAQHGKPPANPLDGYEASEWVFLTPDFEVAAAFAREGTGRGRPKVCTVIPTEEVVPDHATLHGEDGLMFRTRGWARVVDVTVLDRDVVSN